MDYSLETLGVRGEKDNKRIELIKMFQKRSKNKLLIITSVPDENMNFSIISNIFIKNKLLKILDDYIYCILSWMIFEITTNDYPCGKNYHNICIKIIYMKNHLEGKEFFNDETILDKIHIDFKESIILNTESKWNSILTIMEYILPEDEYNKFSRINFNKELLQDLCNKEKKWKKNFCDLIEDIIKKITDFFIDYVKELEM